MSRSERAAKGFAAALLQYACQILVQILLAPVVLLMAGRETLGAYAAIMQALGMLALVDIAGSCRWNDFWGRLQAWRTTAPVSATSLRQRELSFSSQTLYSPFLSSSSVSSSED